MTKKEQQYYKQKQHKINSNEKPKSSTWKKSKSTIAKLLKNKYYPLNILKFFPGYIFPSQ